MENIRSDFLKLLILSSCRLLEMADQDLAGASCLVSKWFHSCQPHEMYMRVENVLICLFHYGAQPGHGSAHMHLKING
jgi:hypothetical protein